MPITVFSRGQGFKREQSQFFIISATKIERIMQNYFVAQNKAKLLLYS